MAFSDLGSLGATGTTTNNQTTLALTTAATASAGNLVVLVYALDNTATSDGDSVEIASITDSAGGNNWYRAGGFTNGQGSAQAGAHVEIWYSVLRNTISSGGTVTANFNNTANRDAQAVTGRIFSIGSGMVVSPGESATLANDAADPGSLDVTTRNVAHLRIRGIASEVGNNTNLTNTTNWTAWANGNSAATGTIGEMCARAEHYIVTATSAASDPTYVSADTASFMEAFYETPVLSFLQPFVQPDVNFAFIPNVANPEPSSSRLPAPTQFPDKWYRPLSEPVRDRRQHPLAVWAPQPVWNAFTPASTFNVSVAETASATDNQSSTLVAASTVSESTTSTDSQSAVLVTAGTVSETASATDSQSHTLTSSGTVGETTTATDGQSSTLVAVGSVSESAPAIDDQSSALVAVGSVSESAPATDSQAAEVVSSVIGWLNPLSEAQRRVSQVFQTGGIVIPLGVVSANVYNETVVETVSATDAQSSLQVHAGTLAETSTATDSQSASLTVSGVVSETSPATDNQSANEVIPSFGWFAAFSTPVYSTRVSAHNRSILVTPLGIPTANVYNDTVGEALTAQDNISSTMVMAAVIAEQANAVENFSEEVISAGGVKSEFITIFRRRRKS